MPLRIRHWTPHYLFRRALLQAYQLRNPEAPWLTARAIEILRTALRRSDRGLEWGSGRSTLWLAERTAALVSVESSAEWFEQISKLARHRAVANLDYRYVAENERRGERHAYVDVAGELPDESLDYVLIDGLFRAECAAAGARLVKPGGILILDDAERYLPLAPHLPEGRRTPAEPDWQEFATLVTNWRLIWTSDGISATALWIRAQ